MSRIQIYDEYGNVIPEYPEPETEFPMPEKEMASEDDSGSEFCVPADDYPSVKGEDEFHGKASEEEIKVRKNIPSKALLVQLAAALVAGVVISSSFDLDFLGDDSFSGDISGYSYSASASFPELDNLDPNGSVPGYGIINEEYIMIQKQNESVYLWKRGELNNAYPGASYDRKTNTLYLDNVSADFMEVNLMGNGFRIEVTGDCFVEKISIWGFGYGGSVTFGGTGRLTVNRQMNDVTGFEMNAEFSRSCIMIEKNVTLQVYGTLLIDSSGIKEALFCSDGVKLYGGKMRSYELTSEEMPDESSYLTPILNEIKKNSDATPVFYHTVIEPDGTGESTEYFTFTADSK